MSFLLKGGKMVKIDVSIETFSSILGGLYSSFHGVDTYAIPPFFWLQLAYELSPYLENWRYDIMSFEEWLSTSLVITAEEICTEEDIEYFKNNTIFIRTQNGNMSLIGAGDIIWENSTDTSQEETKSMEKNTK